MTLSDLTSNAHYVALAGLGAVIAAGWRQVRSFFSYIYGFLVVQATLESTATYPMMRYLRQEWKVTTAVHQTLRMTVYVPYKVPNHRATYYRGPHFLFVDGAPSSTMKISTFRWTPLLSIVKEAMSLDVKRDLQLQDSGTRSRFYVYDIVGRDKSINVEPLVAKTGSGSSNEKPLEGSAGSAVVPYVFQDLDRSFMYDIDEYTETPKSHMDGTPFLPPNALELLKETETWFRKRDWFRERAIPHRRGILLHGPGGTGKSTFAVITARKLAIPVYRFHLNTLSDKEYLDEISRVDAPALVLFEDFDQVFNKRQSVKNRHLSFDTVINTMSGVKTLEGVLFVLTTNNLESIDPAIGVCSEGSKMSTRPGRIDRILHMGSLPDEQRMRLIERTLQDWPDLVERAKTETDNFTIVQTQEYCVQLALERLH
jgi:hypothetical protein